MPIDRFLDHLAHEKRCSPHTVAAYARDIGQFVSYLGGVLPGVPIHQADTRSIRGWVMHLMEDGVGPRSVNRKLSALRAYFRFARIVGDVQADPMAAVDPPKVPGRLPEFVPERGMVKLFEAAPEDMPLRDRLILELLYGTGMRLAELLGLHRDAVDLKRGTIRVLGKRDKERLIPLGDHLVDLLAAYQDQRPVSAGSILLVDDRGEPLARRSVQRLVARHLGRVTTQKKRSPHVLRHTFATHMLEQGADLNAVKELLGHAGLAATQVYTHNTVDKLRRVHAQAHPRGGGERNTNEQP